MENKKLPLLFVKKREIDERKTEGAGGDAIPKWVPLETVPNKCVAFRAKLDVVADGLRIKAQQNQNIPTVLTLKLMSKANSKDARKCISSLFNSPKKQNIIGMGADSVVYVKVDSCDEAYRMSANLDLESYEKSDRDARFGIASIETMEEFAVPVSQDLSYAQTLKVRLFDYLDEVINHEVESLFESLCVSQNIVFVKRASNLGGALYSISGFDVDQFNVIKKFEGVKVIEEMPLYYGDDGEVRFAGDIEPKVPVVGQRYPCVGVLDSGIAPISKLHPWILAADTPYLEEDMNRDHGTFVGGIIVYGDELLKKNCVGSSGCMLVDYAVVDSHSVSEDELLNNVEEAFRAFPDVRIWNLSVSPDLESNLSSFSDSGMEIDKLQDKYNVLICKSAGNCIRWMNGQPVSHISPMADSVRSLVVGSVAQIQREFDIAAPGFPSPFSKIGRGPGNMIVPQLVHYGGNVGMDNCGNPVFSNVFSFGTDGALLGRVGTSFSTPRVAALAAELMHRLPENTSLLLVKALLAHSAKYAEDYDDPIQDKIAKCGFGMPPDADSILHVDEHESTLILQDSLAKGEYVEILDFPYPESLVSDGRFYGRITITLVANPVLIANQGAEYVQSRIDVGFGTYTRTELRDMRNPRVKNPMRVVDRFNVLRESVYSKPKMATNTDFTDRLHTGNNEDYIPIKKWCVDLSELQDSHLNSAMTSDKHWYLTIQGFYRNYVEELMERKKKSLSQDFCLIVSISDPRGECNVYDDVLNHLSLNGFVYNSVENNVLVDVSTEE